MSSGCVAEGIKRHYYFEKKNGFSTCFIEKAIVLVKNMCGHIILALVQTNVL